MPPKPTPTIALVESPHPAPISAPISEPIVARETALAELHAAAKLLGFALSARMLLLLALVGVFVLGLLAIQDPKPIRLWTLVVYAAFTVLPVTYLEARRGRSG